MHLIVFPLIIYLLATGPILLLWPQRGLCTRNYWIAIGAAMAGLVTGFVLMILLSKHIHVGILMYGMIFIFPLVFAIPSLLKFGTKGRSIGNSESVLLNNPLIVCRGFVISTLCGTCLAITCAVLLQIESAHITMTWLGLFPLALLISLIQVNFLSAATPSVAIKTSLSISATILVMSFILGPYFIVALPLVLYSLVASFVLVYFIYSHQKPNNNRKNDSKNARLL